MYFNTCSLHLFYRKIVLVAVEDNGNNLTKEAIASLERIGGHDILTDWRYSYALIGWTGPGRLGTSVQVWNEVENDMKNYQANYFF